MPSMPILRTPAFSEICSPSPASSSGTPAVMAPSSSEVRNGSVSRASMSSPEPSRRPFAAEMIEVFDDSEENQQQRHQHQHEMLRHADATRCALAANHQCRKKQRESDHP